MHVVHAWSPYGEALLDHPGDGLAGGEIERYLQAQRDDHAAWFEALERRIACESGDVELEMHLVHGSAAQVIPSLARETRAGLVVMGTVGTSSVPGVLIGTTAEAVLSAVEAPVLALKPGGFTSPIQFNDQPNARSA